MTFVLRLPLEWKLRTQSLTLGRRTLVMGVLNLTPDSFSDGGRHPTPEAAIERGLAMFEEGASIVDIGGESTRPGNRGKVSATEEMDRVLPVIEGLRKHLPGSILSIDTYKSETALAALQAGAEIVNDVSGFLWDPAIAPVSASARCGVVLMHTRGRPEEWRNLPTISDLEVTPMVKHGLEARLSAALDAGIARERIVLDPGFGFGKLFDSNYSLLAGMEELQALGRPLLVGVSHKSFLGRTMAPLRGGTEAPVEERANASLAAATAAILAGAAVIRAHDVRSTGEAAAIADAVLAAAASLDSFSGAGRRL